MWVELGESVSLHIYLFAVELENGWDCVHI
jgi:hypothetical protein